MIFVGRPKLCWYHTVGYQRCFYHYQRCELSC